ncbi:MAG: hypothetical protein A2W33_07635 [Chloroflexi bacterium RBG_16_52_11]|nr:MAG: hypothetical protein A2W33_07635 [Chloroflexi bacterium RBG_16_52_11]
MIHLKTTWPLLAIAVLFLAALGIRVYRINEPPLDFHATRQYRSLLIARGYYYEGLASIPEWKRQVARINLERQGVLEPPVMERLTSYIYRIAGSEPYWIPRTLSILFWLIGGGILYLIAKKIMDGSAALFSTVFYLFLPFAVVASRSFQPDPLMIMLLLASLYAILQYTKLPSLGRLVVVIVLSAFAIYIKPISLFVIYSVFVMIAVYQQGIKRSLTDPRLLSFLVLTFLPTATFYFYGILVTGTLREQARSSFLPQLLIDPFYWKGWLNNIHQVVGLASFIGALLGVMLFRRGLPRVFMMGLWVGYVLFCLVFNYHIATHDYYHLQLVPIVALSLGPMAGVVYVRLKELNPDWHWRVALWTIMFLALVLALNTARTQLSDNTFGAKVKIAEEIGERVHHSTNTVYLASDYGLSLEYHGELSGEPWPLISDLEWERLAGITVMDAEQRFDHLFVEDLPDYFIIVDQYEFDQQRDLIVFLTRNYPVMSNSEHYIIFDLQRKL